MDLNCPSEPILKAPLLRQQWEECCYSQSGFEASTIIFHGRKGGLVDYEVTLRRCLLRKHEVYPGEFQKCWTKVSARENVAEGNVNQLLFVKHDNTLDTCQLSYLFLLALQQFCKIGSTSTTTLHMTALKLSCICLIIKCVAGGKLLNRPIFRMLCLQHTGIFYQSVTKNFILSTYAKSGK